MLKKCSVESSQKRVLKFSGQTIRNVSKSNSFHSQTSRNKPYISPVNKGEGLEFPAMYITKTGTLWKTVVFCDESEYNLFDSDVKVRVWRKSKTELDEKNVNLNIKHGGGNFMI